MIISPNFGAIKARAIALLTSPDGFNGYTADEVGRCGYGFRNNIGVALCMARDEVEPPTAGRKRSFNIGNFNKAEKEIAQTLRA